MRSDLQNLKRNLIQYSRHGLRLAALLVPVAWFGFHALFGPQGYLALRHKQQQYQMELARVEALEARNRELNHAVTALQSDPAAIEGIAREQLHLTRPGEVVYTYTVPTPSPAATASNLPNQP